MERGRQYTHLFPVLFVFLIVCTPMAFSKNKLKQSSSSLPPLKLQGSQFVDSGGNRVELKGFNYFGFK